MAIKEIPTNFRVYYISMRDAIRPKYENAVDEYLDLCQKKSLVPEQPFKGSLNIRLGKELHRKIALAANSEDISINAFIKNYLEQATNKSAHNKY